MTVSALSQRYLAAIRTPPHPSHATPPTVRNEDPVSDENAPSSNSGLEDASTRVSSSKNVIQQQSQKWNTTSSTSVTNAQKRHEIKPAIQPFKSSSSNLPSKTNTSSLNRSSSKDNITSWQTQSWNKKGLVTNPTLSTTTSSQDLLEGGEEDDDDLHYQSRNGSNSPSRIRPFRSIWNDSEEEIGGREEPAREEEEEEEEDSIVRPSEPEEPVSSSFFPAPSPSPPPPPIEKKEWKGAAAAFRKPSPSSFVVASFSADAKNKGDASWITSSASKFELKKSLTKPLEESKGSSPSPIPISTLMPTPTPRLTEPVTPSVQMEIVEAASSESDWRQPSAPVVIPQQQQHQLHTPSISRGVWQSGSSSNKLRSFGKGEGRTEDVQVIANDGKDKAGLLGSKRKDWRSKGIQPPQDLTSSPSMESIRSNMSSSSTHTHRIWQERSGRKKHPSMGNLRGGSGISNEDSSAPSLSETDGKPAVNRPQHLTASIPSIESIPKPPSSKFVWPGAKLRPIRKNKNDSSVGVKSNLEYTQGSSLDGEKEEGENKNSTEHLPNKKESFPNKIWPHGSKLRPNEARGGSREAGIPKVESDEVDVRTLDAAASSESDWKPSLKHPQHLNPVRSTDSMTPKEVWPGSKLRSVEIPNIKRETKELGPLQDSKDVVNEPPWAKHRRKHFSTDKIKRRQETIEDPLIDSKNSDKECSEDTGKEILPPPWTNHLTRHGGNMFKKGSGEKKLSTSNAESHPAQSISDNAANLKTPAVETEPKERNSFSVQSRLQKWNQISSSGSAIGRVKSKSFALKDNGNTENFNQNHHASSKTNNASAEDSVRGVEAPLQNHDQIQNEQEPSWIVKPPKAHASVAGERGKLGDYLVNDDKMAESDPTSSLKTAKFSSKSTSIKGQQELGPQPKKWGSYHLRGKPKKEQRQSTSNEMRADIPHQRYGHIGKPPQFGQMLPKVSNGKDDNDVKEDPVDPKKATNISLEFSSIKERINAISVSDARESLEISPKSSNVGSNTHLKRDMKRSFVANDALSVAAPVKVEKEKVQLKEDVERRSNENEESQVREKANASRTNTGDLEQQYSLEGNVHSKPTRRFQVQNKWDNAVRNRQVTPTNNEQIPPSNAPQKEMSFTGQNKSHNVHMWRQGLKSRISTKSQGGEELFPSNRTLKDGNDAFSLKKTNAVSVVQEPQDQRKINAPHVWQHIQKKQEEHRMKISNTKSIELPNGPHHKVDRPNNSDIQSFSVPETLKKDPNSERRSYDKKQQQDGINHQIGQGSQVLRTRKMWKHGLRRRVPEVFKSEIRKEVDTPRNEEKKSDFEDKNTKSSNKPHNIEKSKDEQSGVSCVRNTPRWKDKGQATARILDRNGNKGDTVKSETQNILNRDIDDLSKSSVGSKGVKTMLSMFESLSCKTQQGHEVQAKPLQSYDAFATINDAKHILSAGREYEEKEEVDSKKDLMRGPTPHQNETHRDFTAPVEDTISISSKSSHKEQGQRVEKVTVHIEDTNDVEEPTTGMSGEFLKKTSQDEKEFSGFSVNNKLKRIEVGEQVTEEVNPSPFIDQIINIESKQNVIQDIPLQMCDHPSISYDSESSVKQNEKGRPDDYLKCQQSSNMHDENLVEGKVYGENYETGRPNEMLDNEFSPLDSMNTPFNDIPFHPQPLNDIPWSEGYIDRDYGPPKKQIREKVFFDDHLYDDDDDCDGVTLSPTTSEVSSLSVPSCLLSIDSSSISESSSSSDEDTGAMESTENTKQSSSVKGPSEASSSQTSEAATPLIHSALGSLTFNFGLSSSSPLPHGFQNQVSSFKGILSYNDDEPNKNDDDLSPAWHGDDRLFNTTESTNVPLDMPKWNNFNSELGSDCQTFFSQSLDFPQIETAGMNGSKVMSSVNVDTKELPVNEELFLDAKKESNISLSPSRELEKEGGSKETPSPNSRRRMFERTYPGVPTSQSTEEISRTNMNRRPTSSTRSSYKKVRAYQLARRKSYENQSLHK